jgi:hypothetical protein
MDLVLDNGLRHHGREQARGAQTQQFAQNAPTTTATTSANAAVRAIRSIAGIQLMMTSLKDVMKLANPAPTATGIRDAAQEPARHSWLNTR